MTSAWWADLVGPQIAAVTDPRFVGSNGVLSVRVRTEAWAAELRAMTPRILELVTAGESAVTGIDWVTGPERPTGREQT